MIVNERQRSPTPTPTPGAGADGRFITITFDASMPLRPQFERAKDLVTDHTLRWLKLHPEDAPLRVAKRKNQTFYVECARINEAIRQGVPRDVIQRELWPTVDRELARRRFNYRVVRWRKLVAGGYPVATDQTSVEVVFPCTASVDRVPWQT